MLSTTFTASESNTFTITNARHITARIKTDLKRLRQLYPQADLSDAAIDQYHEEATQLLRDGYLGTVTYGFKRDSKDFWGTETREWVVALKYVVVNGELDGGSEAPGGIKPGVDTGDSPFYSYLTYSAAWGDNLTYEQREQYKKEKLPFQRTGADEPTGNWRQDRSYGQGGRHVNRYTTF